MQLRIFSAPPPILRPHRSPDVAVPVLPRRLPSCTPAPAMVAAPRVTAAAPAAPAAPISDAIIPQAAAPAPCAPAGPIDAAILAVLGSASPYGESVATTYARKERELAAAFAALTAAEAQQLHTRLTSPAPGDVTAAQFERLVAERRARLLALLADGTRRTATKVSTSTSVRRAS